MRYRQRARRDVEAGFDQFVNCFVCKTFLDFLAGIKRNNRSHDLLLSKLLHNLADGAFSKAVKDARTPLDWLSTDPAVVDAYIADDLCGQTFTAGAYATLTSLTAEVATLDSALEIPSELPILLVAGALDPVGNKGRGVKSTAALFEKAGIKDVEVKLYQGMRHEILNEPGKQQVYDDVLAWIDRHIS